MNQLIWSKVETDGSRPESTPDLTVYISHGTAWNSADGMMFGALLGCPRCEGYIEFQGGSYWCYRNLQNPDEYLRSGTLEIRITMTFSCRCQNASHEFHKIWYFGDFCMTTFAPSSCFCILNSWGWTLWMHQKRRLLFTQDVMCVILWLAWSCFCSYMSNLT